MSDLVDRLHIDQRSVTALGSNPTPTFVAPAGLASRWFAAKCRRRHCAEAPLNAFA
jgi:hypothetical protein